MLPRILFGAFLLASPALGQQGRPVTVESEVMVRAESFACKEKSELDRLIQRENSGGFTSGMQLYNYLRAHKCVGLSAGRARVYSTQDRYVCLYDAKDNKIGMYPCAWTRRDSIAQ